MVVDIKNRRRRILRQTYPAVHKHYMLLQLENWAEPWASAGIIFNVNKLMAQFGHTDCMVTAYTGRYNNRLQLPMASIQSRLCMGELCWDRVRTRHELGLVCYPHATGKMLATPVPPGLLNTSEQRRNAQHANLALELLKQHQQFVLSGETPADTVQLPVVYAGFNDPQLAQIGGNEVKRRVSEMLLDYLPPDMSDEELQRALQLFIGPEQVRMKLFVKPDDVFNTSKRHLIRQDYLKYVSVNLPLYEDYTALCGLDVVNPAQFVGRTLRVFNPARMAAEQLKIDLGAILEQLRVVQTTEDNVESVRQSEAELVEQLAQLLPVMRCALGTMQHLFTDDDLYAGIMTPRQRLVGSARKEIDKMSRAERLDFGYGFLASELPYVWPTVFEADMLTAFEQPHMPLYARKLCVPQHVALQGRSITLKQQQLGRRIKFSCEL